MFPNASMNGYHNNGRGNAHHVVNGQRQPNRHHQNYRNGMARQPQAGRHMRPMTHNSSNGYKYNRKYCILFKINV